MSRSTESRRKRSSLGLGALGGALFVATSCAGRPPTTPPPLAISRAGLAARLAFWAPEPEEVEPSTTARDASPPGSADSAGGGAPPAEEPCPDERPAPPTTAPLSADDEPGDAPLSGDAAPSDDASSDDDALGR